MKSKILFLDNTTWSIFILSSIPFSLFFNGEGKLRKMTEYFHVQFRNVAETQLKTAEAHLWFEELIRVS